MFMPRYARHASLGVATNFILGFLFETLHISSMRVETLSPKDFIQQMTQQFAE